MQQIERYGVIALLFLLVTIVVVALWDGGDPTEASEGDKISQVEDQRSQAQARARSQSPARGTRPQGQNQGRATQRTSLNRTGDNQLSASQRQRLLNPDGMPADPNARTTRRKSRPDTRLSQRAKQRPVQNDPIQQAKVRTDRRGEAERPFQTVSRRGRDLDQWNRSGVIANTPEVKPERVPVVRTEKSKAAVERKPRKSMQGPIYVIKPGDSLERIARATLGDGQRWREIRDLNGMKNDVVIVGKKLRLPLGGDASGMSATAAKKKARDISRKASASAGTPAVASAGTYVVQKGDYLGKIAEKQLGSSLRWREIVDVNPGMDPKRLMVGTRIQMPARGKTAKRTTSKPKGRAVAKADDRYTVH